LLCDLSPLSISIGSTRQVFARLDPALQAPSLHPDYVCADALRDPNLRPDFFVFQDGGEVCYHSVHLSQAPGTELYDAQSHYGYGGPVASTPHEAFLSEAWSAYRTWYKERRVLAEFIRFHPLLENWRFYEGEVIDNR